MNQSVLYADPQALDVLSLWSYPRYSITEVLPLTLWSSVSDYADGVALSVVSGSILCRYIPGSAFASLYGFPPPSTHFFIPQTKAQCADSPHDHTESRLRLCGQSRKLLSRCFYSAFPSSSLSVSTLSPGWKLALADVVIKGLHLLMIHAVSMAIFLLLWLRHRDQREHHILTFYRLNAWLNV